MANMQAGGLSFCPQIPWFGSYLTGQDIPLYALYALPYVALFASNLRPALFSHYV